MQYREIYHLDIVWAEAINKGFYKAIREADEEVASQCEVISVETIGENTREKFFRVWLGEPI